MGEPGGDWTRRSHFLKVFDRDGDIRIYVCTIKLICPRPGQTLVVHQVEPAPPSRCVHCMRVCFDAESIDRAGA